MSDSVEVDRTRLFDLSNKRCIGKRGRKLFRDIMLVTKVTDDVDKNKGFHRQKEKLFYRMTFHAKMFLQYFI